MAACCSAMGVGSATAASAPATPAGMATIARSGGPAPPTAQVGLGLTSTLMRFASRSGRGNVGASVAAGSLAGFLAG